MYLSTIFGYKKDEHFNCLSRQHVRGAIERTVRLTESLLWALGVRYLLQERWEKIVWYNLVRRPHRVLYTDARGRGELLGSAASGGVLLAWCESWNGFLGHHSLNACPVSHALERFVPSEREHCFNDAETLAVFARLRSFTAQLINHDLALKIDSSPALGATRNANSKSHFMRCLAGEIWLWADHNQVRIWVRTNSRTIHPC